MEKVLVLRTCKADMTACGGFVWPESGECVAPDWDPTACCGYGLHGLLWGLGSGHLLSFEPDAKWMVVETDADSIVALDGGEKVKFPKCEVVYCGTREGATQYIYDRKPGAITGLIDTAGYSGTATAGDYGTATAGDYGTATAGVRGTATAGYAGTATAGYSGTATAGYSGTATAGDYGTATAGEGGILSLRWYDGKRYRIETFYVGENGILPNQAYCLSDKGQIEKVAA